VPYSQQVLAVLVRDRQRAIADDRAFARRAGLRRRFAAFVYALAKGVTVLAVVIDDEPVYAAGERAR
jgi:hypothetical protein